MQTQIQHFLEQYQALGNMIYCLKEELIENKKYTREELKVFTQIIYEHHIKTLETFQNIIGLQLTSLKAPEITLEHDKERN